MSVRERKRKGKSNNKWICRSSTIAVGVFWFESVGDSESEGANYEEK